jgi:SAM-dependent methyltransferase
MHQTSKDFMDSLKRTIPRYFNDKIVLEVGSQDINGTNNYLFENCKYVGLDLGPGRNVDVVSHVADFEPHGYNETEQFDTIISTNAFEHDRRYLESIVAISLRLLKPKGLFAFSCASLGSQEHGTSDHYSNLSPHTNDYYKNLVESDIREALDFDEHFAAYAFAVNGVDLQFWGIKKDEN